MAVHSMTLPGSMFFVRIKTKFVFLCQAEHNSVACVAPCCPSLWCSRLTHHCSKRRCCRDQWTRTPDRRIGRNDWPCARPSRNPASDVYPRCAASKLSCRCRALRFVCSSSTRSHHAMAAIWRCRTIDRNARAGQLALRSSTIGIEKVCLDGETTAILDSVVVLGRQPCSTRGAVCVEGGMHGQRDYYVGPMTWAKCHSTSFSHGVNAHNDPVTPQSIIFNS